MPPEVTDKTDETPFVSFVSACRVHLQESEASDDDT
jgi:hypothetical protein